MKIILVLIISLFATLGVSAQGHKTPEERATKQSERLTKHLGLSAEQSAKVKAASLTRITAVHDAKTNKTKGGKKAAYEKFDADLKTILSQEQYTKYEQSKEEAMAPDERAERRAHHFQKELLLSDEVEAKMETILMTKYEKIDALGQSGTKEQKEAIRTEADAAVKLILTPEQFAKYNQIKDHKGNGKGAENGKGGGKGKGKNK